ncbi:MAG: oligoendopeptidase F [Spirochaetia bacterium]
MSIPERSSVDQKNKWNLIKLFPSDKAWQDALKAFMMDYPRLSALQTTMLESAKNLRDALDTYIQCDMRAERLGYYAMLRLQENIEDSTANAHYLQFLQVQADYSKVVSFFRPKIQDLDTQTLSGWIQTETLRPFKIYIDKIIRFKPHILPPDQEALLAPLSEIFSTPDQAFSALTDADMDFGDFNINGSSVPLTQSTFTTILKNADPQVRLAVYEQFYGVYEKHKNVISTLFVGSIRQDLFSAKSRNFKDTRQSALFADNIPESVYDNLIETVRNYLPVLHQYYHLRKKILNLPTIRHCDVYTPLFSLDKKPTYLYDEAVELICASMKPLGDEYCRMMHAGLTGNWVDRYENKGKSSGAFSAGSYLGDPYILINYKEDNLRLLFTLAHEAGHSMHSLYSVKDNLYQDYDYSIFEAETASTFNESLLFEYMCNQTSDPTIKRYLIAERIDDILSTLFRQTMFAEFEKTMHQSHSQGIPLTLEFIRSAYRQLLHDYFGPAVEFSELSDLECLRIPHFYRSFYVYKYATGVAASLALSKRVISGGANERDDYLSFLKSGGRQYPLESLAMAGVDMNSQQPIIDALKYFKSLVSSLETSV